MLVYDSDSNLGLESSLPHRKAGDNTASKQHADVDCCGLDNAADGANHAQQLHKANTTQLISNEDLEDGAYGFAGNIYGADLEG